MNRTTRYCRFWLRLLGLVAVTCAMPAYSTEAPHTAPHTEQVKTEYVTVSSPALAGNLAGESTERNVIVYLPPGYDKQAEQRYPVVYALHGYGMTSDSFAGLLQAPHTLNAAFAAGTAGMIVVVPDTQTRYNGSMYSSSVTIGDWESFIAEDLVHYIDRHYRTFADRNSRGLAGHSMGGYGTTRIGMKRPDVFGALYIMSPCCLSAREAPPENALATLRQLKETDDVAKLDFMSRATLTVAAAWSPNPNSPPFYVDLPSGDEASTRNVLLRWAANAPLVMVDQYSANLRRYRAIAMDVGDEDSLRTDAKRLHQRMAELGVTSDFQVYPGDHGNRVGQRFQNHVLPFFGRVLAFGSTINPATK